MSNKKYKLETILELMDQGYTQSEIGRELGCDHSVIWRQLQKISSCKTYNELKTERMLLHSKRLIEYEKEKFDNLSKELKHKFDVFSTFFLEYLSDMNERINILEKREIKKGSLDDP